MAKDLKYLIEDVIDGYMKQYDKDFNSAAREVNKEMYKEAVRMYKSYIKDFYSYKTELYVRYGTDKPGTGKGKRLYEGMDITTRYMRSDSKHAPTLTIRFPGDLGYVHSMDDSYKNDLAENVLDYVLDGIRYPWYRPMSWKPKPFKGRYFYYEGTMRGAFNSFNRNFNKIAEPLVRSGLSRRGWL